MKAVSFVSKTFVAMSIVTFMAFTALMGTNSVDAGTKTKYAMKDIVGTAMGSSDHTMLVTAVKAADLVKTLQSAGPFTVFAPTNAGFNKLPEGKVPSLLKKENKGTLQSILTYHVVAGKYGAAEVMNLVNQGGGKAVVRTVQGGKLLIMAEAGGLSIMDEKGGKSRITATDLNSSNGVIHVVDTVLMPK